MGSTRAGGVAAAGSAGRGADLVAAAAALRWARPDLTAALADHVLEEASAAGERERWLAAAGWAVHARATTGDGRDIASEVLAGLSRWGTAVLDLPAARRLRVELAMVAAGAGEVESARRLAAPVVVDTGEPELLADLLCVHARCAVEDTPDGVVDAIDAAAAAWASVEGPAGEIGGASVALIDAVVQRRAGRPAAAVERAKDGLARLERGRAGAGTPSSHLGAALAAEWLSALLDAGRAAEADDGCGALLPRLSEWSRPTRQLALLRLTVARVLAAQDDSADTAQLLERAAEDAAGSGASDLEAVCRTALGALYEKADRLDVALETLQLAVTAERRDRARARRFAQALAELPPTSAPTSAPEPAAASERATTRPPGRGGRRAEERAERFDEATASEATTVLPAITRGDRKLARSRWEELLREGRDEQPAGVPDTEGAVPGTTPARSRFERMLDPGSTDPGSTDAESTDAESLGLESTGTDTGTDTDTDGAEPESAATGWGAVSWSGSTGESPIGDLLIRKLRSGAGEPGGGETPGRRNGRSHAGRAADETAEPEERRARRRRDRNGTAEPGGPSGWMPAATDPSPPDERPARSRGSRGHSRPDDDASGVDTSGVDTSGAGHPGEARDTAAGVEAREHGSRLGDAADERPTRRRADAGSRHRTRAAERAARAERSERTAARSASEGPGEPSAVHGRHDRTAPAGEAPPERPGTVAEEPGLRPSRARSRRGAVPEAAAGTGDDTGTVGDVPGEAPPVNGRRHRADDPWATGRWTVTSADRHAPQPEPDHEPDDEPSAPAAEPDGWLQAALADLDRVLGSTSVVPRPEPEPGRDAGRDADGCAVVVDIARDGRRFAGRRAGAVVRAVADRLDAHLPPGAHQRFGDSDTLVISRPGWERGAATEWMHRTLPDLLAGFVPEEDLPAAQLRAAVHDADGPVGAQILQELSRASGRASDPWNDLGIRKVEPRGAAHPADRRGGPDGGRRGARSSHSVDRHVPSDEQRGWPWSGDDSGGGDRGDLPDGLTAGAGGAGATPEVAASSDRGVGRHEAGSDAPAEALADPDTDPGRRRHADGPGGRARTGAGRRGRREAGPDDAPREEQRPTRARRERAEAADREGARRRGSSPTPSSRATDTGPGSSADEQAPVTTPEVPRAGSGVTGSAARGVNGPGRRGDEERGTANGSGSAAAGQNGAGEGPERGAAESGDGLGIADLLAGALAAYRGI